MLSPALAIGWELWARNRRGIAAVAAGLIAAGLTGALLPTGTAEEAVVVLSSVFLPVAIVFLLSAVSHCEFREGRLRLGFPARMLTLPMRTGALVAWPMLYGVGALTLLWVAMAVLVWIPAGVEPLWWLVPLLAVALVWFQAICWAVPGPPLARVLAACVVLPALKFALEMIATYIVMVVNHEPRVDHSTLVPARPVIVTIFAACFLPLAYAVAVVGVSLTRRGTVSGWTPTWHRAGRVPARGRPPFRSAARAQLWFEWRRKGAILPLFPLCSLLFLAVVVAPFVGARELVQGVVGMVVLVLAVAFAVGYGFGKTSFWASDLHLSAFHGTRPLGSGSLASAKLGAAALSALATTTLVVLGVPLWLWLLGRSDEVARWLAPWLQGFDGPSFVFAAVLGGIGLFTLTWGQLVGGLVPSLTGRAWVVNGVVATYLALATGLGLVARYVGRHPDALGPTVEVLSWSCWSLIGVKLFAAVCVLRASRRRGLLSRRAMATSLGVWSAGVGGLLVITYGLLTSGVRPLAISAVLLVPLVRLVGAPMALAWNRHR
ncbi:hypothetical protein [Tautonia plasticadhaerens]|uniref:Uncharacterized protein n=1 Tax=Tautonia plasticadhaerens TaxID=2527974 RepID=A0A518H0S7_9BACT|nr:hypothetical protein [Tautonia plasticadhaerens]QDV34423.1 hypothetical protein ElP_23090 [Tautonia plasticadhaerens]